MKSEVCKIKVDTPDELLVRILDAGASIKEHEGRLQQHSIFAQTFQSSLWIAVGFSNNKFIISV
jgi:hypothetical protein